MTRARSFTKAEIMDAARAAAETGLMAKLCPTGEILFAYNLEKGKKEEPETPEAVLAEYLSGRKARRVA